jgi:hypothetical protein
MRFMILMKANEKSEAGEMPSERLLTEMGRFNQELMDAGVLLSGEGLHPSSRGARVRLSAGAPEVVEGPFPNPRELVGGFWMIQTESLEEAIDWMKRVPNPDGTDSVIEIRQVFEAEDFGEEFTPEAREAEARMRQELAARE